MDPIKTIPNLADQIEDVLARVERAGMRVAQITDEGPPCLSTREGQALFRQQLQPWLVVLRNGGWPLLWARVVCEVSYWLGRAMTGLGVREAWRLVRVR